MKPQSEDTGRDIRPERGDDANRIAVERDLQRQLGGPYQEGIGNDTKSIGINFRVLQRR